jgi:acetyl-CoA synthetase
MSERKSGGHAIETMQIEERRFKPSPEFSRQANAQPDIYERGFDEFWNKEAGRISWFEPWEQLYEWKPPFAKWYIGGRLNVCYNCVDRHVEGGRKDKVAFFWEGEPTTIARRSRSATCRKRSSASPMV